MSFSSKKKIALFAGVLTFDLESLTPTIEVIDNITGRTLHNNDGRFKIFTCDVYTCGQG